MLEVLITVFILTSGLNLNTVFVFPRIYLVRPKDVVVGGF